MTPSEDVSADAECKSGGAAIAADKCTEEGTINPFNARESFEKTCKALMKWEDLAADKYWQIYVSRQRQAGRHGLALKRINELIAACADNKKGSKETASREELYEERMLCLSTLGVQWEHIFDDAQRAARFSAKDCYEPF